MQPPTVLIIGCGVAGPAVAVLLKRKGFRPVIYEKVREYGDVGGSLTMMPNGLKVLALLGLADEVVSSTIPLDAFTDESWTGERLGSSRLPTTLKERFSQPAVGVTRTSLVNALMQLLKDNDIEVNHGYSLEYIQESNDKVVAMFQNGEKVEGTFLVGCDGIKSPTRDLLLRRKNVPTGSPLFTGMAQTVGRSPTPASLRPEPAALNIYGPAAHFIMYPVSSTHTSWILTLPDATSPQETWGLYGPEQLEKMRTHMKSQFAEWTHPVPELIATAERMTRYGLYDRPELEPSQWHTRRCVLLGDSAHPTTPHFGQGANQALEDCYHLTLDLTTEDLSGLKLESVFHAYAVKRQQKTKLLVKGARRRGEKRVVTGGPVACQKRDDDIKREWTFQEKTDAQYDILFREPFQPTAVESAG